MTDMIVQAIGALTLIAIALSVDTSPNIASKLIFRVIPLTIGVANGFFAIAKFMGWPS